MSLEQMISLRPEMSSTAQHAKGRTERTETLYGVKRRMNLRLDLSEHSAKFPKQTKLTS